MKILTKYYRGIYNQIQAEVELINELLVHQGLKGEGNEIIIRDLIKKFIPKKYGVGTGIIIDKDGESSKQCDIIIYDNHYYPEIFTLSNIHLFPVDLVYAVIEVKTTLDIKQARLSIDNIKSIKTLNYIKDTFRVNPTQPIDIQDENSILFQNEVTTPPLGLVFAYQSNTSNFKTLQNWFKHKDLDEQKVFPSHIFCLDHGFVLTQTENSPMPILCPLIDKDTYYTMEDLPIIIKNGKKWAEKHNMYHPVSTIKKQSVLIDQSKILINFIMILTQLLQKKIISPQIDFRKEYFSEEQKTFFTIMNDKITILKDK